MKKQLTDDEKLVVEELLKLAGGMGCPKDCDFLNEHQRGVIKNVSRKGYVTLTRKWFMVVLPP